MKTLQARPFVKWVGGKQAIAPALTRMFPATDGRYYEPFLGGGSVLFAASPLKAVCGDMNAWLVDTYVAIRDRWQDVAAVLDTLPNTKDDYLRIRAIPLALLDPTRRAAHFIYLNKTCFRGLFRVNARNQFNVPYGEYDRRYYDREELAAAAKAMEGVELRCGDFELTLAGIGKGDFAYMDPPYYKMGGHSDFNRYTKDQFRDVDHIRLAAACRELDARGVLWAVSNSDTPFVRALFDGYRAIPVANRREINLNSQSRGITELLIVNYAVRPVQPTLFPSDG